MLLVASSSGDVTCTCTIQTTIKTYVHVYTCTTTCTYVSSDSSLALICTTVCIISVYMYMPDANNYCAPPHMHSYFFGWDVNTNDSISIPVFS